MYTLCNLPPHAPSRFLFAFEKCREIRSEEKRDNEGKEKRGVCKNELQRVCNIELLSRQYKKKSFQILRILKYEFFNFDKVQVREGEKSLNFRETPY